MLVKKKGWVTLDPSGTHVFIDGSGNVTAGPAALTGRPINRLSQSGGRSGGRGRGRTAPSTGRTEAPARTGRTRRPSRPTPQPTKPDEATQPLNPEATAPAKPKPQPKKPRPKAPKLVESHVFNRDGNRVSAYDKAAAKKVFGKNPDADSLAGATGLLGVTDEINVEAYTSSFDGKNYVTVRTAKDGVRASRTISVSKNGEKVCHNDYFFVDEAKQGGGIGLQMLSQQVEDLPKIGCYKIETEAARSSTMVGYKVWPKFGYDGPIPTEQRDALKQAGPQFARAKTIQELYAMPGGPEAWDKHGGTIDLVLDLTPGSKSMKIFNAYLEKKRALQQQGKAWRSVAKSAAAPEDSPEPRDDELRGDQPDLSPEDQRAIDEVWRERASEDEQRPREGQEKQMLIKSPLVRRKASDADLLAAVRALGNFAPLDRLGSRLGLAPAQLHALVQALRRAGKLTASVHEGRHGLTPDQERYLISEGGERLGFVSVKSAGTGRGRLMFKGLAKRPVNKLSRTSTSRTRCPIRCCAAAPGARASGASRPAARPADYSLRENDDGH